MNDIDMKIKDILSADIGIPNSYKNMIRKSLLKKNSGGRRRFATVKKVAVVLCAVLAFTVGGSFGSKYVVEHFFNFNKGIDKAIEQGYLYEVKGDYTYCNDVGIRVDNIFMNEYNLNITFSLKMEDTSKFDNLKLQNLLIYDEENRVLFCHEKDVFEKFCRENNLDYEWAEFGENYANAGLNSYIKEKKDDEIVLIYNMYSDVFPKSKVINIEIGGIGTKDAEQIISGDWSMMVDLPEKMYNSAANEYVVESCSNENFEVESVVVTNTQTKLYIVVKEKVDMPYDWDDSEEVKEKKIAEWQKQVENMTVEDYWNNRKFNNAYIENEKGERFYPTYSTDDDTGYAYFDMEHLRYWQTFDMTDVEIESRFKFYVNYKGEDVEIVLVRKCI